MKETIYYCDKCKKRLEYPQTVIFRGQYHNLEFDLCQECANKIYNYIQFNQTNIKEVIT